MAITAQPQTLSVILKPTFSTKHVVSLITLILTYLGLQAIISDYLPGFLPLVWATIRYVPIKVVWTLFTLFLADPFDNAWPIAVFALWAILSFFWELHWLVFWFIAAYSIINMGFRVYRALEAVVVRDHLDAGKGGTPANWWGWWRLYRCRHFSIDMFSISVSPYLRPYRGILHAADIPMRAPPRPAVIGTAPQRQRDQKTAVEQFEAVEAELRKKAIQYSRDLVFETSFLERLGGTLALKLRKRDHPAVGDKPAWSTTTPYVNRPEQKFIKTFGYEIAHAHHADGSLHVVLHPEDVRTVIEQGYGERHPLASTNWMWDGYFNWLKAKWDSSARSPILETLVFLYAPRNHSELISVMKIVDAAIWFFTGEEVDSNKGKGPHRKDRYLDEYDSNGTIKVKGELDAKWPATSLQPSTADEARKNDQKAFNEANTRAARTQQDLVPALGATPQDKKVYNALSTVLKERSAANIKPPKVVVITDIGKDYDDLTAMIVLKELQRLGFIELKGFVTNLKPADQRARYGKGALRHLGLESVPIAIGTIGSPDDHPLHGYEFFGGFSSPENIAIPGGSALLSEICREARKNQEKLTFLLISSLRDIWDFQEFFPNLQDVISNVVMQGSYFTNPLQPDMSAANNKYDPESARNFHAWLEEHEIKTTVFTKEAAFATLTSVETFNRLASTGHLLGDHLRQYQQAQDLQFYRDACGPNPKFFNQVTFLKRKTSFFDGNPNRTDYPDPRGDDILPFLTKAVMYDALAAIGAAGQDIMRELGIKNWSLDLNEIVGTMGPNSTPGIDGKKMAETIEALLFGALQMSPRLPTAYPDPAAAPEGGA